MAATPVPSPDLSLDSRVRRELVRMAYADSIFGAPFGTAIVLLFAYAVSGAFPRSVVMPWLVFALACNAARLVTRWLYLRQPEAPDRSERWARIFTLVSGATGFSWGLGAWLFYTPHDSSHRVLVVLVLAGLTTGASRLLAPIFPANLSYLVLAIAPLQWRIWLGSDVNSYVLGIMSAIYLLYMGVAAHSQARTIFRTIRLGYEHAALVVSLGAAKEQAEKLNQNLSAEIARREVVEAELRAASERATAANRAKTEFLATMSHEIRTPMNGLIGMLRIVRDTPLSPSQREHVETAAASADTLLDLLNNILDFSKIEAGRLDLERIVFSPSALVNGVVMILRPRARAKGLELVVELDEQMPRALIGDPTRLKQVLFNLVGNAIKFTDRGQVTLRTTCVSRDPRAARISFTIADTGIGIDSTALSRLFNPFTQADNSMSRRFGGTGLGLAISQKIVAAMESKITAESVPGHGSTFAFTVELELAPAASAEELRSAAAAPAKLPKLRGRVLVVEDDRINQRVIGHFLKQMGLETGLAEDGHTAVDYATGANWDAVLMDCQLPGLDGLEATRRIRQALAGRSLPIIALTANASLQDRDDCLAAGMNDFLTKPIRAEILAASLQKWMPAAATAP